MTWLKQMVEQAAARAASEETDPEASAMLAQGHPLVRLLIKRVEELQAESERLRADRNVEKQWRKEAEDRAEDAEAIVAKLSKAADALASRVEFETEGHWRMDLIQAVYDALPARGGE